MPFVNQHHHVIILLEPRVVNSGNGKHSCPRRVLHEMGSNFSTDTDFQHIRHRRGDQHLIRCLFCFKVRDLPLFQILPEKSNIIPHIHPFQHNPVNLLLTLENSRFLNIPVHVLHTFHVFQALHQTLRFSDHSSLTHRAGDKRHHTQVSRETRQLFSNLILKTRDNKQRQ